MSDTVEFKLWMGRVTRLMENKYGLSPYDLSDQPYWDWFDDGVTPGQAMALAVRDNF